MTRVRVYVNEAGIQSMFIPGGQINEFGRKVAGDTTRAMNVFATQHRRTGRLRGSFRTRSQVRHNQVRYVVASSADHALFLERGTRFQVGYRRLYAGVQDGRLPPSAAKGWAGYVGARVTFVGGTPATHFMSNALRTALRANGLA